MDVFVGVHHTMNEAEEHPLCDELCMPGDHTIQEGPVRPLRVCRIRVVSRNGIVSQRAHAVDVALRGEVLKGAHAKMACSDSRKHRTRQHSLTQNLLPGDYRSQGAGGWHAQCRHRFAHNVLAQNRTEGRTAIATARKTG